MSHRGALVGLLVPRSDCSRKCLDGGGRSYGDENLVNVRAGLPRYEQDYRVTGYIPEGNDSNISYSRKAGFAPFSLINSSLSEASHTIVLRSIYHAGRPLRLLRATASLVAPASVEAHDLLRGDRETTQSVSDTLVNARKSAFDPKRCEAAKLNISHLPTLCQRR